MKTSLRLPLLLILLLCTAMTSLAIVTQPDFAYPKKVITTSEKTLKEAIKKADNEAIVRSLINLTLANSLVSNNSLGESLQLIKRTSDKSNEQSLKALLEILQADIYSSIYMQDRWKYDQRQLPVNPRPADYNEWSGEQFRIVIDSLLNSAVNRHEILLKTPLKSYSDVITIKRADENFFPTLFDFVGHKSLSIMDRLSHRNDLNPRWLNISTLLTDSDTSFNSTTKLGIRIIRLLLRDRENYRASYIYNRIKSIEWVNNHAQYMPDSREIYTEELLDLYSAESDTPESALALLSASENVYLLKLKERIYSLLKEYDARFPESTYTTDIKNTIRTLTKPSARVWFPSNVAPNHEFETRADIYNARKVTFKLYRVKATESEYILDKLIESVDIIVDKEGPFKTDTIVRFSVPDFGEYTILPVYEGQKNKERYFSTFICSNLFGTGLSTSNGKSVYVSDILSGQPIEGASVISKNKTQLSPAVITDNQGKTDININANQCKITKGKDVFLKELYIYENGSFKDRISATSMTSLPIYHLGDDVDWVTITFRETKLDNRASGNENIKVIIRDPNYQIVDSISGITDEFGRLQGKTKLPSTGLTGYFSINVFSGSKRIGGSSFMVSDYKLPTFTAEVTSILRNSTSDGSVTIKGIARSYSGFPIADATVNVSIQSGERLIWYMDQLESFYSTSVTTDSNGEFLVELTPSILSGAPYPTGMMRATFDVTSPAGETRSTSTAFTLGKPYEIMMASKSCIDISQPISLGIQVLTPTLEKKNIPLSLKVMQNDSTVLTAHLESPDKKIDLSVLPTGEYNIEIIPVDTTLADTYKSNKIILYNPSKNYFPLNEMMWIPSNSVDFTSHKGEILIGTDRDKLIVNMIVTSNDSIISQRWVTMPKGLNHVHVELPEGINSAKIHLISVNNLEQAEKTITITTPAANKKMEFRLESFRDKVVPLSTETWSFTAKYPSDHSPSSAVILSMISKAIDDIQSQRLPVFPSQYKYYDINISSTRIPTLENYISAPYNNKQFNIPGIPTFNLYNMTWLGNYYVSGRRQYLAAGAADGAIIEEKMVLHESAIVSMKSEAVNGMVLADTESEEEDEVAPETNENITAQSNNEYRPSEIPLAIFSPMLTTDTDGKLHFSFTYPNASTTWLLNGVAYDNKMHSATLRHTIVASHPIMVQSNLPRFIRQNDTATLAATVMNNTENRLDSIQVEFETLDMNSNTVVAESRSVISLDAMSSAVVTLDITAPVESSSLIVRIKASSVNYSDGEQTVLAVLPSSQPVITICPFYMAPDSTTATIDFKTTHDSKVTVEFCENPSWTVVTALPGLLNNSPTTSTEAATTLFSAAVADGIMRGNPEIVKAFHTWLNSDRTDSTLVSMLEKNADLKIALLNATPWVVDAMSDTQRMTRLSLLLNRKEIDKTYSSTIQTLARLQRKDGGWAWTDNGTDPSEWATESILFNLGNLRRLGYLPNNTQLNTMIEKAVKFLDATVAKRVDNIKSPVPDLMYTYIRTLFPKIKQSTAASRVSAATVQYILANWKRFDLAMKPVAAMILQASGYHSTSLSLLQSLEEYSSKSAERGMWWDNIKSSTWLCNSPVTVTAQILDAFATIDPKSKAIDPIRQWLIIEKSRQDWGNSASVSMVIASILNSGTRWLSSPVQKNAIHVNGHLIESDNFERITGYTRAEIPSDYGTDLTFTFDKISDTPAYGAIYSRSTMPMSSIEARSIDGLSIQKRFLVRRNSENGFIWEDAASFNVGDIVKTVLTVKSEMELSYATIIDNRPACLEPVQQLPGNIYSQGIAFYRETRDASTSIFIDFLPKGTYILEQEFSVTTSGAFSSGVATIQSQYAPQNTASSSGMTIPVKP